MHEAINQIDKGLDKTTMKINCIKYLSPEKCLCQMKSRFHDLPLAREEGFGVHKVDNQYEKKSH